MKGKTKGKITSLLLVTALTLGMSTSSVFAANTTMYKYLYNKAQAGITKENYATAYDLENVRILNHNNEELSDDDYIGTGMKLVIGNSTSSEEYQYVYFGDLNGDGKISSLDLSREIYQSVRKYNLEGAFLVAANLDQANGITALDVARLSNLLIGLGTISRPDSPDLSDGIIFTIEPETPAQEVTLTVEFPTVGNDYTKQISYDGGETWTNVTGNTPISKVLTENANVIAQILDDLGNVVGEKTYTVQNIDTTAPVINEVPTEATSSVITISPIATDSAVGADGNEITDGIAGISGYITKLDDGEWQEGVLEYDGLEPDTEYTISVKAIDNAGNESEIFTVTVKTLPLISPLDPKYMATFSFEPEHEPGTYTKDGVSVKVNIIDTTDNNKDVTEEFENMGFHIEYLTIKPNETLDTVTNEDGEVLNKEDLPWNEINNPTNDFTIDKNCKIYVRYVNESGKYIEDAYAETEIDWIDNLGPEEFTPTVERSEDGTKLTVSAHTVDKVEATGESATSGSIQYLYKIVNGKEGEEEDTQYSNPTEATARVIRTGQYKSTGEESWEFTVNADDEYTIFVTAFDLVGNEQEGTTISTVAPDVAPLNIDVIMTEPGHTVNETYPAGYFNPEIPVGFKAIETQVSWYGNTPLGWNDGLVIEDINENQFVWVPVKVEDDEEVLGAIDRYMYNERYSRFTSQEKMDRDYQYFYYVIGEEVPDEISYEKDNQYVQSKYRYRKEVVDQIEKYGGFYVARYEAGFEENSNSSEGGYLASKQGLIPMSGYDYYESKAFAEGMYQTDYLASGLITGTQYDLMAYWINGKNDKKLTSADGNMYYSKFTFTGKYQLPAGIIGEITSEEREGANFVKNSGTMILNSTGLENTRTVNGVSITDGFRLKNIYDLYGNVSEFTSEITARSTRGSETGSYSINAVDGHAYRGWSYGTTSNSSLSYRTYFSDEAGRVTNTNGFRVMLFMKPAKNYGNIVTYNTTIDGKRAKYNNPVIPAGFKAVDTTDAIWGAEDAWNNGLVIEDSNHNQFVWVPVDGKDVIYETFDEKFIRETNGMTEAEADAFYEENYAEYNFGIDLTNIEGSVDLPTGVTNEKNQIQKYGGFYVARYEASKTADNKIESKENVTPITGISYSDAKTNVESLNSEGNKNVKYGIITCTQWDTIANWINNDNLLVNSYSNGNYSGTINNTSVGQYVNKNIYDFAGNSREMTAQHNGNSIIYRDSKSTVSNKASMLYRGVITNPDNTTSFRMVLYVDGKVLDIAQEPVKMPEQKGKYYIGWHENNIGTGNTGYLENDILRIEVNNGGYTRGYIEKDENGNVIGRYIIATLKTKIEGKNVEYKIDNDKFTTNDTWVNIFAELANCPTGQDKLAFIQSSHEDVIEINEDKNYIKVKVEIPATSVYVTNQEENNIIPTIYSKLADDTNGTNALSLNVDWFDYEKPVLTIDEENSFFGIPTTQTIYEHVILYTRKDEPYEDELLEERFKKLYPDEEIKYYYRFDYPGEIISEGLYWINQTQGGRRAEGGAGQHNAIAYGKRTVKNTNQESKAFVLSGTLTDNIDPSKLKENPNNTKSIWDTFSIRVWFSKLDENGKYSETAQRYEWTEYAKLNKKFVINIPIEILEPNAKYKVFAKITDMGLNTWSKTLVNEFSPSEVIKSFTPSISVSGTDISIKAITNTENTGDNYLEYSYLINGDIVHSGTETEYTYHGEANKTYLVSVMAKDKYGNIRSSERFTVSTDTLLINGKYISARLADSRIAGDANKDWQGLIYEKDANGNITQTPKMYKAIIDNANTLEVSGLTFDPIAENATYSYQIVPTRLVNHTTIISGDGSENNPYVTDGEIEYVIKKIKTVQ